MKGTKSTRNRSSFCVDMNEGKEIEIPGTHSPQKTVADYAIHNSIHFHFLDQLNSKDWLIKSNMKTLSDGFLQQNYVHTIIVCSKIVLHAIAFHRILQVSFDLIQVLSNIQTDSTLSLSLDVRYTNKKSMNNIREPVGHTSTRSINSM